MLFLATLLALVSQTEDLDFADGLARRGWNDLAREIYQTCLKSDDPAVARAAKHGLADKSDPEALDRLLKEWPKDDPRRPWVEYDYSAALYSKKMHKQLEEYLTRYFFWVRDMTQLGLSAHILLARSHLDRQEWNKAWREFTRARHEDAPAIWLKSLYFEIRARVKLKQHKEVRRRVDSFFIRNPSYRHTLDGIAVRLEAALAYDAAEAEKRLREIAGSNRGTWAEDVAMEYLDRILGDTRPEHLVARGDWFFGKQHYTQAASKYQRAVDKEVDSAHLWYRLGLSYFRTRRWDKAANALMHTRRFPRSPEFTDGAFALADAYEYGKDSRLTAQLAWIRKHISATIVKGRLGIRQGRRHMDVEDWSEAPDYFRQQPDNPEAVHLLAYCLNKLKSDKALETFEAHLKLNDDSPRRVTWSYYFVTRHAKTDRRLAAAAEFRKRVSRPDTLLSMWIRAHEAEAHIEKKDLTSAESAFGILQATMKKEELGLDPVLYAARRLATAFHEAERFPRAAKYYLFIADYSPDEIRPEFLETLAAWLFQGGDFESAYGLLIQIDSEEIHILKLRIECLIGMKQYEQAVRVADATDKKTGDIQELRGDAYLARALNMPRNKERVQWLKRAADRFGKLYGAYKYDPDHSYRLLLKYATTLIELDIYRCHLLFQRLDREGEKNWGGREMKEKFDEIRNRVREKMPRR